MNGRGWLAALVIVGVLWWSFRSRTPQQAQLVRASETIEAESTGSAATTSPTLTGSSDVLGNETYANYDARRDALDGSEGETEGDGCTVDCGGHAAGREWAEQRGVTDEAECGGNSWSFREGCVTYAREQEDTAKVGETGTADAE
jgi:hypothetical protein